MNKHCIYTLLLICIIVSNTFAQTTSSDIVIGKTYQLQSELLEDILLIQVSTPANYNDSENSYPVLYVLDAQWFFPHALSIRADFTQRNGHMKTPEFIVVGITTNNDKRWNWSRENTSSFLKSIESDVIPFVDTNYRTSRERILFGWEITAGFVVQSLSRKPELFSAYIAASPAPLYGEYFKNLENEYLQFKSFLQESDDLNTFLFIGQGESDYPVFYGTHSLTSLLETDAPSGLKWHHKIMIGFSHQMCAYRTLQEGLKTYYKYHQVLTFNNKAEFEQLGGFKYVETFYKERGKQFNLENDDEFKHATRRNLSFVAISENDYNWFDSLLTAFEKNDFFERSFAPHLIDYAEFYLKHDNISKATELVSFTIDKYPENAQVQNKFGDIKLALLEYKEAQKYYEKAVEIGLQNDDWRTPEYKKDLMKIQNKQ